MLRESSFRETPEEPEETDDPGDDDDLLAADGRIRCPKCKWQPRKGDSWQCACLFVWNTFDTRGQCPACNRQWHDTQCLRCHEWSPHEAWYA